LGPSQPAIAPTDYSRSSYSTIGYPLAHLLPSLISISIFISRLHLRRSSSDFILHLHRSFSLVIFIAHRSSLIIFIAHHLHRSSSSMARLHHYFVRIIPAFPFVFSCFLELFFLYSYSTLPRPQLLVGLLINASYIADINFPCITAPFAFCASYQTSKCKILLPPG
jgi:hypothetical protein